MKTDFIRYHGPPAESRIERPGGVPLAEEMAGFGGFQFTRECEI